MYKSLVLGNVLCVSSMFSIERMYNIIYTNKYYVEKKLPKRSEGKTETNEKQEIERNSER